MYSSLGNGRHNQNVLKVLVLLSLLLLILVCYQHHTSQKTQMELERDIAISEQRAKQVEYELDSIQKGLQLDLNKERTEHKRTKVELTEARNSLEAVMASQKTKEQNLEVFYGKLQECQKQNVELEKICDSETEKVNIQLNDCLGKKMALDRAANEISMQNSRYSSEVNQLNTYIQQLQTQIQQKDNEINRYRNQYQRMQQGLNMGQQNMGQQAQHLSQIYMGVGEADEGGAEQQQQMQRMEENLPQQQENLQTDLSAQGQNFAQVNVRHPGEVDDSNSNDNFGVQNKADPSDTAGNEGGPPINWRSQNSQEHEEDGHVGPDAPDGLIQESDNLNVPRLQAADPVADEPVGNLPEGQLKPPDGGGNEDRNPAEVDVVAGDGKGALLPPMGDQERKALEDRIQKALEMSQLDENDDRQQSNLEVKREFDGQKERSNFDQEPADVNDNVEAVDQDNAEENLVDDSETQLEGDDDASNQGQDLSREEENENLEDDDTEKESENKEGGPPDQHYEPGKAAAWAESKAESERKPEGVDAAAESANNRINDFNDGSELNDNLPDFELNQ